MLIQNDTGCAVRVTGLYLCFYACSLLEVNWTAQSSVNVRVTNVVSTCSFCPARHAVLPGNEIWEPILPRCGGTSLTEAARGFVQSARGRSHSSQRGHSATLFLLQRSHWNSVRSSYFSTPVIWRFDVGSLRAVHSFCRGTRVQKEKQKERDRKIRRGG